MNAAEIKPTTRPTLSPKLLKLPSSYRTTAWLEVYGPWSRSLGRFPAYEIARFSSRTAGTMTVYACQHEDGRIEEISHDQFFKLLTTQN